VVGRKCSFKGLYLLATHSLSSGGSGSAVSFPLWFAHGKRKSSSAVVFEQLEMRLQLMVVDYS